MTLPATEATKGKEHELAGDEGQRLADRIQADLEGAVVQSPYIGDRVIVDRNDVAGEQLAVEVGGDTCPADDQKHDTQQARAMQNGIDDGSVRDGHGDEQSGEAVCCQPMLVAGARHAANRTRPSRRAQTGGEGPDTEDREPGKREISEPLPQGGREGVRGRGHERDVRQEQEEATDRHSAVPQCHPVQSPECGFDDRQQRGEDQ